LLKIQNFESFITNKTTQRIEIDLKIEADNLSFIETFTINVQDSDDVAPIMIGLTNEYHSIQEEESFDTEVYAKQGYRNIPITTDMLSFVFSDSSVEVSKDNYELSASGDNVKVTFRGIYPLLKRADGSIDVNVNINGTVYSKQVRVFKSMDD
jgi:hypothetical protein